MKQNRTLIFKKISDGCELDITEQEFFSPKNVGWQADIWQIDGYLQDKCIELYTNATDDEPSELVSNYNDLILEEYNFVINNWELVSIDGIDTCKYFNKFTGV